MEVAPKAILAGSKSRGNVFRVGLGSSPQVRAPGGSLSLDPSHPFFVLIVTQQKRSPAKRASCGLLYNRFFDRRRLTTYAANATGVDHVDQVSHMLNAWHMPNRFLHELLQIKGWQLAGQKQRTAAVLDKYVVHSTAKMRVVFQVLTSQHAQIIAFARLGRRLSIKAACIAVPPAGILRRYRSSVGDKVDDRRCLEKGFGLLDKTIPAAGSSPSWDDSATRMPKEGVASPEKWFDGRVSALPTKSSARASLSAITASPSTGRSL